jgi:beta-lactamase class A
MRPHPLLSVALLSVAASTSGAGQASPAGRLEQEFARIEPLSGGTLGVAVRHLESGRTAYHKADQQYPLASTYKLPMAIQAFTLAAQGKIDLDRMVAWDTTDLHIGSEAHLLFRKPGFAMSVRNLIETMMILSENNATDLVLAMVGGGEAVTRRLREAGITEVRVDRPTADIIAHPYGITDIWTGGKFSSTKWRAQMAGLSRARRDSAAYCYARDPRDHGSPRAMMELVTKLWQGQLLSREHTDYLLDIMYRCETGAGRLKGMLPPGTRVAHKTGTYPGTTNDVGIVDLPDGTHLAIAVYVKGSQKIQGPDLEAAIAHAARASYDYFLYTAAQP